ncbi:uncharacterized protein LOC111783440 [Cucurbita pepo subsp. pepo]|uniref:uncharacterized protein LOC111783440 n=1 Tax=Cucurbita pepo subsp. pepo TaxID=3664 RepID=UPI000C9D765F|nr:uncharacterized protein LOC111783440 [Cucurbita pepo subsp. pepo]
MEDQQVLQNLDSLWFFATVFSNRTPPPPPPPPPPVVQKPTQNDFVEPPGGEIATPIFQNQQNVGEERNIVDEKTNETGGGLGLIITEERRKSRGRRWGCLGQRRKIVGEMDLSDAVKEICECWLLEQRIGGGNQYQRGRRKMKKKKMPPFEDSMAMKEHIRSWAFAVACIVR